MKKVILSSLLTFMVSCLGLGTGYQELSQRCENGATDFESCSLVDTPTFEEMIVIKDSFERDIVSPENSDLADMWWRTVINDRGVIFDGLPAKNVDAAIFTSDEMGPAAGGDRALYFYGREGRSVHNIYLISKEFDLSQFESVELTFSFLAASLEAEDYLRVEVCNDTAENCGVGDDIDLSRFESGSWAALYEMAGEGDGFNGKNHTSADFITETLAVDLNALETTNFVFRFNVRMDEGFINDVYAGKMEDGLALDEITVRATTMKIDHPIF